MAFWRPISSEHLQRAGRPLSQRGAIKTVAQFLLNANQYLSQSLFARAVLN